MMKPPAMWKRLWEWDIVGVAKGENTLLKHLRFGKRWSHSREVALGVEDCSAGKRLSIHWGCRERWCRGIRGRGMRGNRHKVCKVLTTCVEGGARQRPGLAPGESLQGILEPVFLDFLSFCSSMSQGIQCRPWCP